MSPGYIGSAAGGRGAGFNTGPRFHGHGYGRIAAPAPRQHFAQRTTQFSGVRQRFSVGGDGKITLDSGEQLVVAVDENGAVSIGVGNSEPVNGPGAPSANGKNGAGQVRRRMGVFAGNDGSITIEPEGDNTLQIVGSPEDGVVAVIELEPAPPVSPKGGNGQNGQ
jgi:hypothetical protein